MRSKEGAKSMICLAIKKKSQEKSAYATLRLYLLLQTWFKKQEENAYQAPIVREWFID